MNFIKYCESNEILLESGFIISDEIESKFSLFIEDDGAVGSIGSFSFEFINDKGYDSDVYRRDVHNYAFEYLYINFDENNKSYKKEGTEIIEGVKEIKNVNFHQKEDIIFRYKITGDIGKPKILYYNIFTKFNKIHDNPKGLWQRIFG
ncbi:MAG: hypothetical protein K0R15_339 [Clostridiales bacterium]|jgi:hypothetical protein|nr:hypothetical protein [Clostridiales bacterium]